MRKNHDRTGKNDVPGSRCTVCDHPERKAIEAALAVASLRVIERQYRVNRSALQRHKTRHVHRAVARVAARREELSARALLERMADLLTNAEDGVSKAKEKGDLRALAPLLRETRETLVRLGQVSAGLWAERNVAAVTVQRLQVNNFGALSDDELRNLARLGAEKPLAIEAADA